MNPKVKNCVEWIECFAVAIILAILIKYFVGTPTVVKMSSMSPTLKQDDRLVLNRLTRTFKKLPDRGDIITFEKPSKVYITEDELDINNPVAIYDNEPKNIFTKFFYYVLEINKQSYIKRVIGLPGEHVEIKNGGVYINGEELEETYLNENVETTALDGYFTDLIVPENCVFAMGDNRPGSRDCRSFGCIPLEKIEGKIELRFFPFNKFGNVKKINELKGN